MMLKTNFEIIKQMDITELGEFLCSLMCADCCRERCPAKEFCFKGHDGMVDWLKARSEE